MQTSSVMDINAGKSREVPTRDLYGSLPPNFPQYDCKRLVQERTERRLFDDLTERMVLIPDVVCLRGSVSYRLGVSHKGIGPEMTGRSGTGGVFGVFCAPETELVNQLSQPKTPRFAGGGLVGTGLWGHVDSPSRSSNSSSSNSSSSSSCSSS